MMTAVLLLFTSALQAQAACTSPVGSTQAFLYSAGALTYCDGTNWLALGSTDTGNSCATAGEMKAAGTDFQYCNGSTWISALTSTTDGPCSTSGEFKELSLFPVFCDGTNWKRMTNAVPTSNLVLKGEAGNTSTTIADSSPKGDTLTAYGSAINSTAQAKFGTGSLSFNATAGTYISKTADTNLSLGAGDFTVEMWIRPSTSYQTAALADFRSSSNGPAVATNNGKLYVEVNGGHVIDDTVTVAANVWTHVAMVRMRSSLTLYKNGVVVGSSSSAASLSNFTGAAISIGAYYNAQNSAGYMYGGYIDNLRVVVGTAAYSGAFTPSANDF